MLHLSARTKFQQAQAKRLDFSKCTTLPVKRMVESYAGAVGCPEEYVFLLERGAVLAVYALYRIYLF